MIFTNGAVFLLAMHGSVLQLLRRHLVDVLALIDLEERVGRSPTTR